MAILGLAETASLSNDLVAAAGQPALRSPLKSYEWGGDDPIRLCGDAHNVPHADGFASIFASPNTSFSPPALCPVPSVRMFDDDVHMSAVHNPGAGCPIRRPSDLSAPHICTRSHCPGFHCSVVQQLPPLHI